MLEKLFGLKDKISEMVRVNRFGFQFGPEGGLTNIQITVDQNLSLTEVQNINQMLVELTNDEANIAYNIGEKSQINLRINR